MDIRGTMTAAALWLSLATSATAAIGQLDTRFGTQGSVTVASNSGPHILEMPDGRILVVGSYDGKVAIHRYHANGAIDTSFGLQGAALVDLQVPNQTLWVVSAAALQTDGKIVVAGVFWKENSGASSFVARIDGSGTHDLAFGTRGISHANTGATEPIYTSLIVLKCGDILAAISDWTSDRIDRFAPDGRYVGNQSWAIAPQKMASQSDGRLVVTGYHRDLKQAVAMRLDLQGHVDRSFGRDGFAVISYDNVWNLAIEPDSNRIVLCGSSIARLTSDGQPDPAFGVDGTGVVALGKDGVPALDYCHRVLAVAGGGVVYVGIRTGLAPGGFDEVFIGGLTVTGMVDARFGPGTGATAIMPGNVRGTHGWPTYLEDDVRRSMFIRTRSGDALLAWASDTGLLLTRIELGSGASLEDISPAPAPTLPGACLAPPPAAPLPSDSPAPVAPTAPAPKQVDMPAAPLDPGGGGGSLGWLDLVMLALVAALLKLRNAPNFVYDATHARQNSFVRVAAADLRAGGRSAAAPVRTPAGGRPRPGRRSAPR